MHAYRPTRRTIYILVALTIALVAGAVVYGQLHRIPTPTDTWEGSARANERSRFGPYIVAMDKVWPVEEVTCRDGGMRVGVPSKGIYVDVDDNDHTIHAWRDDYSGNHDYGTHPWDGLSGTVDSPTGTRTQHHEWTVHTKDSASGNPAIVSMYGTFYCKRH